MEEYNKTVTYSFNKVLNDYDISCLQSKLLAVEGINSSDISAESISIEYGTFQLTEEAINGLQDALPDGF